MKLLSFNTAADLTGILGLIFIIFSFSFNSALKSKKSKCLCGLLLIFVGVMMSDLITTIYRGQPKMVDMLYAAYAVNMVLNYCMIATFVYYLRMDLRLKPKEWWRPSPSTACWGSWSWWRRSTPSTGGC